MTSFTVKTSAIRRALNVEICKISRLKKKKVKVNIDILHLIFHKIIYKAILTDIFVAAIE